MVVSSTSLMGRLNKCNEGAVRTVLRQAHVEVESLKKSYLVKFIKKNIGRCCKIKLQILLYNQLYVMAVFRKRL